MIRTTRTNWTVPRIWNGGTVAILGGGPSIAKLNMALLAKHRVIAVNCAYKLGGFDACFFGDSAFLERYGQNLIKFPGFIITRQEEYLKYPWIQVVQTAVTGTGIGAKLAYGISTDPCKICWNDSSGACAINLGVLLGARRIVLLGFDMRAVNEKHNYHDDYPQNDVRSHPKNYNRFLSAFPAIAADLAHLGIKCINATPGSSLTVFPIMTPEEALC